MRVTPEEARAYYEPLLARVDPEGRIAAASVRGSAARSELWEAERIARVTSCEVFEKAHAAGLYP